MARIEESIEINAPKEKIWSLVDWNRVPEWYTSIKKVAWTSAEKMQSGATVRVFSEMMGRKEEFDTIVTEWMPNEKVVWRTTSGNMPGEFIATLNPTNAGFKVTTSFDYELPYSVIGKLIDKLRFQKYMQQEAKTALQRMKAAAEK
jgi:uncharacterized membrane protein